MATAYSTLLGTGALLCYASHRNQRFASKPLARRWRLVGYLSLTLGVVCWIELAGWRAGLAVAAVELMLLFGLLPLLGLLRGARP